MLEELKQWLEEYIMLKRCWKNISVSDVFKHAYTKKV